MKHLPLLFLLLLPLSTACGEPFPGEQGQSASALCSSDHEPCEPGSPSCWHFSSTEGLGFDGWFVPECDELDDSACESGSVCAFNPACGLDAPCPGLCVVDSCGEPEDMADGGQNASDCAAEHESCAPNLSSCLGYGSAEGLSFTGNFVSECSEADRTCGSNTTCVISSECVADDYCPGICVSEACRA